jgi:quercetin dioxygenase-like cupin family protein
MDFNTGKEIIDAGFSRPHDPGCHTEQSRNTGGIVQNAVSKSVLLSLGQKLRSRRKALGLTLEQVAHATALTAGFISLVERDLATPSIASVSALAAALSASMGEFLDSPPGPETLTRADRRQVYAVATGGMRYERLSNVFEGSTLRSVIVHEPPGHRSEPVSHPGEELIYVVSGALTVELEGDVTILRAGDSIHFSSRRTHATWNHTTETAAVLWCGTMDIFGEGEATSPLTGGTFS